MQKELDAGRPDLDIQLIGVNEWGQEIGNPSITNGRDIPWLQDVDNNGDAKSDVWTNWGVTLRDVVILDANSEVVEVYNLSQNDLRNSDNYDSLWQLLVDTATSYPGDCNGDGEVNASDLGCVIDVEHRDIVLSVLNTLPGDLDGNGDVSFDDFVVLSTNFGQDLSSYADGNIDLTGGVDFADFVVLSNNFGRTPTPHPGDCDADGDVDASDLGCVIDVEQRDIVLNVLNTLPGDLDGNGDVSFADFVVLSTNFGQDLSSYADGNIDLTGGVDFADFVVFSSNFGRTPSGVAAVPEPSAAFCDEVFGEWAKEAGIDPFATVLDRLLASA